MLRTILLLTILLMITHLCFAMHNRKFINAVRANNTQLIESLLAKNKAIINIKDDFGETPLHIASYYGYTELAMLLISHKAQVNAKDNDNDTPLHWAVKNTQVATTQLLIAHGATINTQNNYHTTPLHMAAQKGNTILISILLSQDADIHAKDNLDMTPLKRAESKNRSMAFKEYPYVMLKTMQPSDQLLKQAIEHGYEELVRVLLKKNIRATKVNLSSAKEHYFKTATSTAKKTDAAIGQLIINYLRLTQSIGSASYGPISKIGILSISENYNIPLELVEYIILFCID